MAKCKKGRTISAHISYEIAAIIEERAAKMGWSVSRYIGYILEDWYARGCPAINNIEEAMGVEPVFTSTPPEREPTLEEVRAAREKFRKGNFPSPFRR